MVKSCVSRSIEPPVPSDPDTSRLVTSPVKLEPSPSNDPEKEPDRIEVAPVDVITDEPILNVEPS